MDFKQIHFRNTDVSITKNKTNKKSLVFELEMNQVDVLRSGCWKGVEL